MEGKVKWYDSVKGYGFIAGEEGRDLFVHSSSLQEPNKQLAPGDRVSFVVHEDPKGPQARNVNLIAPAPEKDFTATVVRPTKPVPMTSFNNKSKTWEKELMSEPSMSPLPEYQPPRPNRSEAGADLGEVEKRRLGDWGEVLLERVLHPITVFGTPAFILILMGYFLVQSFGRGINEGLRGSSGALLPLIISSFLFSFRKHLLERLGSVNVIAAFLSSFVWGLIAMFLVQLLKSEILPLALCEIVLSASFSVLVFGYVVLPATRMLAYYYGTVCGFLSYIVFFGLPIVGK